MQEEVVIKIRNIFKSFKKVQAVNGVDLDILKGEYLALLGPNGAGKTTLVEMIEGIQQPDNGTVEIMGMNWGQHRNKLNKILGISLQETRLIDKLTAKETMQLFASFYGIENKRVDEIFELIKLQDKQNSYIQNLSGGQKQRIALGISILHNPKILLLDEPTTGLDPVARREVWDILSDLRNKFNTTLILTTHYMEEAEYLCRKIVVMDKGKVLAQGTLDELLSSHNYHEIIEFSLNTKPTNAIKIEGFAEPEYDKETEKYILNVKEIISDLPILMGELKKQNLTLKTLECRKMSLNDLFLTMTGRKLNS